MSQLLVEGQNLKDQHQLPGLHVVPTYVELIQLETPSDKFCQFVDVELIQVSVDQGQPFETVLLVECLQKG